MEKGQPSEEAKRNIEDALSDVAKRMQEMEDSLSPAEKKRLAEEREEARRARPTYRWVFNDEGNIIGTEWIEKNWFKRNIWHPLCDVSPQTWLVIIIVVLILAFVVC